MNAFQLFQLPVGTYRIRRTIDLRRPIELCGNELRNTARWPRIVGTFVLGLLLLLGFCLRVEAQTTCPKVADDRAHVCWTAPTQNTNGTAITGAITYTVQQQTGATWTNVGTGLTATDWTSGVLAPGTYTYRVLATVASVQSAASTSGSKTVAQPEPLPPGSVVIAQVKKNVGQAWAYRVLSNGARSTSVYAMVPVGRACKGDVRFVYRGQKYRLVDVTKDELSGTTSTELLAAPCT